MKSGAVVTLDMCMVQSFDQDERQKRYLEEKRREFNLKCPTLLGLASLKKSGEKL